MAYQTKWLKITKIMADGENVALSEVVQAIVEELGLKDQITGKWTLQLNYRELNPNYIPRYKSQLAKENK